MIKQQVPSSSDHLHEHSYIFLVFQTSQLSCATSAEFSMVAMNSNLCNDFQGQLGSPAATWLP